MNPDEIAQLVATAVEKTLGEKLSALETSISTTVDKKNAGLATSLTKEIKEIREKIKPKEPEGDEPGKGDEGKGKGNEGSQGSQGNQGSQEESLALKALRTQVENLSKQAQERTKQEAIDKANAAKETARAQVTAKLVAKGVDPEDVEVAVDTYLYRNEGRLKVESGKIFHQDGEAVVPLEDNLDKFLESTGKIYLRPTKPKGSGASERSSKVGGNGAQKSFAERLFAGDEE
jgi:hypothetical protein